VNADSTSVSAKEHLVSKETGIYGRRWDTIHNGYFADPDVAFPLIEVIKRAIDSNHPDVLVDLGGGTGFILKEFLKHQKYSSLRLINVDSSPQQLSECVNGRITNIQASVDQVSRSQFQPKNGQLMLIARSLLHYFGHSGLRPLLVHIRRQLKEGEIFIHQSACFDKVENAEFLNLVYKLMSTKKWYTTIDNLKSILNETGFSVCNVCSGVKVQIDCGDLAERYQLNPQQITLICKEIERLYKQKPDVFISSTGHFTVWLHYSIFTCKAI
jgi:cyclopropane fatty-acyl-phospholipid synthase-like methyltransferase